MPPDIARIAEALADRPESSDWIPSPNPCARGVFVCTKTYPRAPLAGNAQYFHCRTCGSLCDVLNEYTFETNGGPRTGVCKTCARRLRSWRQAQALDARDALMDLLADE